MVYELEDHVTSARRAAAAAGSVGRRRGKLKAGGVVDVDGDARVKLAVVVVVDVVAVDS